MKKSILISSSNLGCNAAKCNLNNECIIGRYDKGSQEKHSSRNDCSLDMVWISVTNDEDDKPGIN